MAELIYRPPWDDERYGRISAASVDDGGVVVSFANGDVVRVDLKHVVPAAENVEWEQLRVEPFELVVPADRGEDVEISWLWLRTITDAEFARHLAVEADDEARRVGRRLRALRKRTGLSSKELSARAGITPQSLSRIERGRHDVVFTTLRRLLAAMGHSLGDLALEPDPVPTFDEVIARLRKFGFDQALVDRLVAGAAESPEWIADRLARIFGWSVGDLASVGPLPLRAVPADAGWFKHRTVERPVESAYVMYAHYLAVLAQRASKDRAVDIPNDPLKIREEVLAQHGSVRLAGLLRWTWDHGIPVLPLFDPGKFHGACWLINDRPVICLKQHTQFESRWTFDLAHELGHLVRHLNAARPAIVERDDISPVETDDSDDLEDEASDFAGALLLVDADRLAQEAVEQARGRVSWLKRAVTTVAGKNSVEVDALANYVAFRLSSQGLNEWWGVATHLQQQGAAEVQRSAREEFDRRTDLSVLSDDDRALLEAALRNDEAD